MMNQDLNYVVTQTLGLACQHDRVDYLEQQTKKWLKWRTAALILVCLNAAGVIWGISSFFYHLLDNQIGTGFAILFIMAPLTGTGVFLAFSELRFIRNTLKAHKKELINIRDEAIRSEKIAINAVNEGDLKQHEVG